MFTFISSNAQNRPNYEADLRRGIKTDEEFIQELSGNVILRQDNITIKCNNAIYYPNSNESILTGNVRLIQETLTLFTDKLEYNGDTKVSTSPGDVRIVDRKTELTAESGVYFGEPKIAEFRDDVFIEDDSVMIDADYIRYEKVTRNSYGYGNVKIQGKFSNTILYSDSVEYYPDIFYTIALGDPLLYQIDTVGVNPLFIENSETESEIKFDKFLYDTLSVSSDTMRAYREPFDEKYLFDDNVVVTKEELSLGCNSGTYFKDRNFFSFVEDPKIWYADSQLYGDSIVLNVTEDNNLKDVQSYRDAVLVVLQDSLFMDRKTHLTGEYIDLDFFDRQIDRIQAFDKTKSLLFFIDEGKPDGALQISSEKAEIIFSDNEITDIHYSTDPPKNEGVLFPEDDVRPNPSEKNLPGFRWTPERPEQREPPE
jgi:lipopolysaccharide export system protein LptA